MNTVSSYGGGTFSAIPSIPDAAGYSVPSYSISGGGGTGGGQQDILSLLQQLNALRQKNAQQDFGFQSSLLGQQLGEQGREYNLGNETQRIGLDNNYKLGQGNLDLQGRSLDTNAALTREAEASRYKYLNDLFGAQNTQSEFDRNLALRRQNQSELQATLNDPVFLQERMNSLNRPRSVGTRWDSISGYIPISATELTPQLGINTAGIVTANGRRR